ncbi:hypothetical protein PACILC2_57310 [Paenibacillus cisolokensis]|uniref:Xylose isomerase n=1 Tax=Paenibacillus cisolokensis TaxID=1658519 RepID=A0ABQ4NFX9_9BACL|nr:hypothetical protein PACILC2_57310 [Paenibacillus cisolokensis]
MAYFKNIGKIVYEGRESDNPLAFKHYNPQEVVLGKTMEEHLRFAVAYWHTYVGDGSDPFGIGTAIRPWDSLTGMDKAKARVEANFEFMEKLGLPFFCFHDRDIAPEGETLQETNANLDVIVALLKDHMRSTGKKLLWNTANMFTHPRYTHGAGTTCNADVYAYAAAQLKKAWKSARSSGRKTMCSGADAKGTRAC